MDSPSKSDLLWWEDASHKMGAAADRSHASDSIRSADPRAAGQVSEPTASCGAPLASQQNASLRLEHAYEVIDDEVRFIFVSFLRSQFAFRALAREFGDASLKGSIDL